jgi:serine/threonine-protein kinase
MAEWNPTANAIFASILELAPAQRQAYLEQACGSDDKLLGQVEALLAAHAEAGSFLDRAACDTLLPGQFDSPVFAPEALDTLSPSAEHNAAAEPRGVAAGVDLPARYRLEGEIARGGMGCVLRGHDTALRREIAVKVLLQAHCGRSELVHRFLEEAQIAGGLQHPGVTPIYDVNAGPGKQPWFTMKLVQGQTLAKLLGQRGDPGQDRPRLLKIFEQVCQTIAYAHSRGVIHRDLKPDNIMVGQFGEVQVMDWGLAKRVPSPSSSSSGPAEDRLVHPEPEGPHNEAGAVTRAGTILGTPAYMAPEQARGEVECLDERTDVFGLGALLCEILTGQPPFAGLTIQALQRAQSADLADAFTRLDQCGADAELISLARRCLEKQPRKRFRHAGELAAELTAYLESVETRLRQAELARAAEQARAEQADAKARAERRAGRLALALAGCVLALVGLGAGGYLWEQQRRATQQMELTHRVDEVLDKVAVLRQRSAWSEALAEARHAEELLDQGEADPALRERVRRVREELAEEKRDRQLVADLETARLVQAETVAGESRFAPERAIPQFREAFRAYGLPVGEGDPAAAAARLRRRPLEVRQAVSAALEDWLEQAMGRPDQVREPHLGWLRALVAAELEAGGMPVLRAVSQERGLTGRRAALERLAAAADVSQWPPRALAQLAWRLQGAEATGSAARLLRRAWRQYPADFWVNEELGLLVLKTEPQRWAEALGHLMAAVALRKDSPGANLNLGLALEAGGQRDEAIACYRRAVALAPKYVAAHSNLGGALLRAQRLDEAIACFRRGVALAPRYALARVNLGNGLHGKGRLDEAIACYRKAIDLDPKNALAHCNLGSALADKDQLDEAIACYRKAIDLDPKDAQAHYNLGSVLADKGEVDEAMACYRQAIDVDPKFAPAHVNLGNVLRGKGEVDEAIACFHRAIELDPRLAKAHSNLGAALAGKSRLDEAISCFRRAIELDPRDATTHCNLGIALRSKGDFRAALASLRTGHALGPRGKGWPFPLEEWLKQCERFVQLDDLLAAIGKGKARPAGPAECLELAYFCRFAKQCPAAAVRFFTEAFTAQPKLAADLQAAHRYRAAQSAAQAGFGQGNDASNLTDSQRRALRRQALTWLRAELAARLPPRQPGTLPQAVKEVLDWQTDPALACLREGEALKQVGAEERQACQRLWSDIDRLVTATPQGQRAKGQWHAARREWAPAARCYAGVLKEHETDDGHFWFEYAGLLLLSGDRDGYRRACAHMIERCGKTTALRRYHVARARTLAAASKAELDVVVRLAAVELKKHAGGFWSLLQQGALAQRAGQADKATELLGSSLALEKREGHAMVMWLWLALAEQARGQPTKARRWLDRAIAVLDRHAVLPADPQRHLGMHLHNWLEAHVLRQEVEALLKSSK